MKKILYFLCFFVMCSNASTPVAVTSNYVDKDAIDTGNPHKYMIKVYRKNNQTDVNTCAEEIFQRILEVDAKSTHILLDIRPASKQLIIEALTDRLQKHDRRFVTIATNFSIVKSLDVGFFAKKFHGDKIIPAGSQDENGRKFEIGIKIHGIHNIINAQKTGLEITFLKKQ